MTLPAGFSVVMAAVVLAGVGAGFAIGPRRTVPTAAAVIEPPATVPPPVPASTTTTTSRLPRPRCRLLGPSFPAVPRLHYIAGTDADLLQRLSPLLGDISVVKIAPGANIQTFVPSDEDGVLFLPSEDTERVIPGYSRMRVIFYSRTSDPPRAWRGPQPALLLSLDLGPAEVRLLGNEDLVVDLITNGFAPQKCAL